MLNIYMQYVGQIQDQVKDVIWSKKWLKWHSYLTLPSS